MAEDLVASNVDQNCYLQIGDNSVKGGNLSQAQVYVHVRQAVSAASFQFYDLQYWFFYAFRGASIGRFKNPLYESLTFPLDPCGEHQGDWKHITVRIDGNGHLIGVFYSAHTWGTWYDAATKNQPNGFACNAKGQPIVYVAKYSHSCYTQPNQTVIETQNSLTLITFMVVEITGNGRIWDSSAVPTVISGANLAQPTQWLSYKGLWGPNIAQQISPENLQQLTLSAIAAAPEFSITGAILSEALGPYLSRRTTNGPSTPSNQTSWQQDVALDLQLCGCTSDGKLWHTIRCYNGLWVPSFGDVNGQETNDPGQFTAISASAF